MLAAARPSDFEGVTARELAAAQHQAGEPRETIQVQEAHASKDPFKVYEAQEKELFGKASVHARRQKGKRGSLHMWEEQEMDERGRPLPSCFDGASRLAILKMASSHGMTRCCCAIRALAESLGVNYETAKTMVEGSTFIPEVDAPWSGGLVCPGCGTEYMATDPPLFTVKPAPDEDEQPRWHQVNPTEFHSRRTAASITDGNPRNPAQSSRLQGSAAAVLAKRTCQTNRKDPANAAAKSLSSWMTAHDSTATDLSLQMMKQRICVALEQGRLASKEATAADIAHAHDDLCRSLNEATVQQECSSPASPTSEHSTGQPRQPKSSRGNYRSHTTAIVGGDAEVEAIVSVRSSRAKSRSDSYFGGPTLLQNRGDASTAQHVQTLLGKNVKQPKYPGVGIAQEALAKQGVEVSSGQAPQHRADLLMDSAHRQLSAR